jgi:hypothetical protein
MVLGLFCTAAEKQFLFCFVNNGKPKAKATNDVTKAMKKVLFILQQMKQQFVLWWRQFWGLFFSLDGGFCFSFMHTKNEHEKSKTDRKQNKKKGWAFQNKKKNPFFFCCFFFLDFVCGCFFQKRAAAHSKQFFFFQIVDITRHFGKKKMWSRQSFLFTIKQKKNEKWFFIFSFCAQHAHQN